MLSAANTALDLLVFQLVLHSLGAGISLALLLVLAPVDAGAEDDVLAHGGGIGGRSLCVLNARAEFAPCLAIGHTGVHGLLVCGVANTAGCLDLLSVFVVVKGDDGFRAVLVRDGLGGWEIGAGLLVVIIVGPVLPLAGLAIEDPEDRGGFEVERTWACWKQRPPCWVVVM
jgi:hypothetical protein